MRLIRPLLWSRDHWTTIAYAFTCLAAGGRLDPARLRLDGDRHPTRIHGKLLPFEPGHNDIDCLVDAEAAGVLVNVGTGLHPVVRFTEEGLKLGQWLCGAMDARTIRTAELGWETALSLSGADPRPVLPLDYKGWNVIVDPDGAHFAAYPPAGVPVPEGKKAIAIKLVDDAGKLRRPREVSLGELFDAIDAHCRLTLGAETVSDAPTDGRIVSRSHLPPPITVESIAASYEAAHAVDVCVSVEHVPDRSTVPHAELDRFAAHTVTRRPDEGDAALARRILETQGVERGIVTNQRMMEEAAARGDHAEAEAARLRLLDLRKLVDRIPSPEEATATAHARVSDGVFPTPIPGDECHTCDGAGCPVCRPSDPPDGYLD